MVAKRWMRPEQGFYHILFKYEAKRLKLINKSAGETFPLFYKMAYVIDQLIPDREGKNFRRKRHQYNCYQPYREGCKRLKFLVRLQT